MADWLDSATDQHTPHLTVLDNLKARDLDAATLFLSSPSNPITGMVRFNRLTAAFEEWNGSAWIAKLIGVAGGGTGGATPPEIITNLGLGTMALQNNNAVNITGGTIGAGVSFAGLGTMAYQNYDNVNITNGNINVTSLHSTFLELTRATPFLALTDSAAPLDAKRWQFHVASQILSIIVTNDANTVGNPVIDMYRNGMVPSHVKISVPFIVRREPLDTAGQPMDIQSKGGIIITNDLANLSFNLYLDSGAASWKYAEGGMGGWLIHRNSQSTAELNFFGAPYNSGGAGAVVGAFNKVFTLNPDGDASLMRNITIGGYVSAATTIWASGGINTAGDITGRWISASETLMCKTSYTSSGLLIDGRPDNWSILEFRSNAGSGQIQLRTPNNTQFDIHVLGTGLQYVFRHDMFYPSAPDAIHLGAAGSGRWLWVHAIYFNSITSYGFLFDQDGNRGLVRVGRGIELRDPAGLYLMSGGVETLNSTVFAPFGVWTIRTTHVIPIDNIARWCGMDQYRWYGVHAYHLYYTEIHQVSDANEKKDVKPEPLGLNFINRLNPVQYRYKDESVNNKTRHGLIAQEIESLAKELEVKFDGVQGPNKDQGSYTLNYVEFIGPIIKAIQELSRKVDAYAGRNDS